MNGFNQCSPLCRCGSPTRAQVSRQRPSPSMPIHRASARWAARRNGAQPCRSAGCAFCAASQPQGGLGLALRPAYSALRCEAALQGRCAGSYAGSASRAGPNFAEVQGCVHATRRAQSGLGSASRPAYSSLRCKAAAHTACRRVMRLRAGLSGRPLYLAAVQGRVPRGSPARGGPGLATRLAYIYIARRGARLLPGNLPPHDAVPGWPPGLPIARCECEAAAQAASRRVMRHWAGLSAGPYLVG